MTAVATTTRFDRRRRTGRTAVLLGGLFFTAALVAGCTPTASAPSPSAATATEDSTAPAAAPTPDPVLVPGGTAEQNKAFFDRINTGVVAAAADAKGRAFIDALATAGFDKAAMEVTADATSIGLAADSAQFAVKLGDACLIGQYGPKSGGYHSVVAKPIATGTCLVGQTVTIDW